MKPQKILCMITLFILLFCTQTYVINASNTENIIETIYYENGDYLEIILEQSLNRTNTSASKITNYKNSSGDILWYVKLTGFFSYNGERASCESAYIQAESYVDTWKIAEKDCYTFGSTAYGEVVAKKYMLGILVDTRTQSLTITCNEKGELS